MARLFLIGQVGNWLINFDFGAGVLLSNPLLNLLVVVETYKLLVSGIVLVLLGRS